MFISSVPRPLIPNLGTPSARELPHTGDILAPPGARGLVQVHEAISHGHTRFKGAPNLMSTRLVVIDLDHANKGDGHTWRTCVDGPDASFARILSDAEALGGAWYLSKSGARLVFGLKDELVGHHDALAASLEQVVRELADKLAVPVDESGTHHVDGCSWQPSRLMWLPDSSHYPDACPYKTRSHDGALRVEAKHTAQHDGHCTAPLFTPRTPESKPAQSLPVDCPPWPVTQDENATNMAQLHIMGIKPRDPANPRKSEEVRNRSWLNGTRDMLATLPLEGARNRELYQTAGDWAFHLFPFMFDPHQDNVLETAQCVYWLLHPVHEASGHSEGDDAGLWRLVWRSVGKQWAESLRTKATKEESKARKLAEAKAYTSETLERLAEVVSGAFPDMNPDFINLEEFAILMTNTGELLCWNAQRHYYEPMRQKTDRQIERGCKKLLAGCDNIWPLTYEDEKGNKKHINPLDRYSTLIHEVRSQYAAQSRLVLERDRLIYYKTTLPARPQPELDPRCTQWLKLLAGDEERYEDLCIWFGRAGDLTRQCAALVLTGPPGVGKDVFADALAQWLGGGVPVPLVKGLAKFNADIERQPVLYGNEGRGTHGRDATQRFKDVVGRTRTRFERKGEETAPLVGCVRVVIGINSAEELGFKDPSGEDGRDSVNFRLATLVADKRAAAYLDKLSRDGEFNTFFAALEGHFEGLYQDKAGHAPRDSDHHRYCGWESDFTRNRHLYTKDNARILEFIAHHTAFPAPLGQVSSCVVKGDSVMVNARHLYDAWKMSERNHSPYGPCPAETPNTFAKMVVALSPEKTATRDHKDARPRLSRWKIPLSSLPDISD